MSIGDPSYDVAIVGAGSIGLGSAWRLALAGAHVAVIDPAPGSGASTVAAGMLAPVSEAYRGEEDHLALNLESARRYDDFVAELEAESDCKVAYRRCGLLQVAFDVDDMAVLHRVFELYRSVGLDIERLRGSECRSIEPGLSPRVRGGLFASGDHQVDPRRLHAALAEACRTRGVEIIASSAQSVRLNGHGVRGVELADGRSVWAPIVVIAAGSWSGLIEGLVSRGICCVHPVKGEVMRLRRRGDWPIPERTVRGVVRGSTVYVVPRADGEVVVGATVEESGFDTATTVGAAYELLRDATAMFPCLDEAEIVECRAALRPGTPDNRPIIGIGAMSGLVLATGHCDNGILLIPITADSVALLATGGSVDSVVAPFSPQRFSGAAA